MATAHDVANLLISGAVAIAQKVDSTPTGVKPGYRAGLKGTVLPNGKLIDASDTPAGGGSSPQYGAGQISAGTSYSSSSYTLLSYSPSGFASGVYTAPATGKYLYTLYFRAASTAWTAGDELRIYEDVNGTARIVELFTIQASRTMYAQAKASFIVPLSSGDGLSWYIYHTRSGGSISVDLTFVNILGFV